MAETAGMPPTGTPPAGAGTPPAGTPPAGTPPAGTPPTGTPPAGTPPAGTPPAGTPPAGTPPAGTPPVVKTTEELQDAAIAAVEAWQANPADEALKKAAQDANKAVKDAVAKSKEEAKTAKEKAEAEAAKNKPPEKYELKIPEGSLLKPEEVDKISAYAKAKGLSNDAAQAILEQRSEAVSEYHASQEAEHKGIVETWAKTSSADKELGGDNFAKNAEIAKRVYTRFGNPVLGEFLDKTGYGNHPEVLRVFYRIGLAMTNDSFVPAGGPAGESKGMEELFYGPKKE